MKQRPWLIILFLAGAGILAYLLQGLIGPIFLQPLADLWWVLEVLYRSIPQTACWLMLLVLAALIAAGSLSGLFNGERVRHSKRRQDRTAVEDLTWFIAQRKRSRYFRWVIARRVGLLAASMLARPEQSPANSSSSGLDGKDWQPSEEIQRYLEAGLRRYESPHRGMKAILEKDLTLEVDLKEVVAYLEYQMEKRSGRKYS